MQDYDLEDWTLAIMGICLIMLVVGLVIALIYGALNPVQCPEGLVYVPRLGICMEGVKPL